MRKKWQCKLLALTKLPCSSRTTREESVFVLTQYDCRGGTQIHNKQIQTLRQVCRLAGVLFQGCGFAQVSLHVHHKPKEHRGTHAWHTHCILKHWCKDINMNGQLRDSYKKSPGFEHQLSTQETTSRQLRCIYINCTTNFDRMHTKKGPGRQGSGRQTGPKFGSKRLFLFLIVILVRLHVLNSNQ